MTYTTQDANAVETARIRRGRTGRRLFALALVVFLACTMFGWLGLRTRRITAGNTSLSYASISRRGFPSTWKVTVDHSEGFANKLEVRTSTDYWQAYRIEDIEPQPASEASDGGTVLWTF